jgi:hypothetical protein
LIPGYTVEQATEDLLQRAHEYFEGLEERLYNTPKPNDPKKLAEFEDRKDFVADWIRDIGELHTRQLQEIALPHLKPQHIEDWEYA